MSRIEKLQQKIAQLEHNATVYFNMVEIVAKARDEADLRVKMLEDVIRYSIPHQTSAGLAPYMELKLISETPKPAARIPVTISATPLKCAILCSGPSLNDTWPKADKSQYGLIIAVNHALLRYDADWLCAGDLGCDAFSSDYRGHRPHVGFCTCTLQALEKVLRGYADRDDAPSWTMLQSLAWYEFSKLPHMMMGSNKSGPNALYLAKHLNASEVYVYGCDLKGDTDCNGWKDAQECSERRWTEERKLWDFAIQDIRSMNIRRVK